MARPTESGLAACWETLRAGLEAPFAFYAAGTCTNLVVLGEKKLLFPFPFLSLQVQMFWCSETQHPPFSEYKGKMLSRCPICFYSEVLFYYLLINHDGVERCVVAPLLR